LLGGYDPSRKRSAIARYYFDYHDNRRSPHIDDEGLEFADLHEARIEAVCSLAHQLKDEAEFKDRRLAVVIRDDTRKIAQVRIWVEADEI